jgi:ATP-binding cassette subfamily B multidrug efflux pump
MSEVTGKALDWNLLKRVMHYVKPYKTMFIISALLTIFLATNAVVQPILIKITLDNYILKDDYNGLVFMVELMLSQLVLQTIDTNPL